MMLTREVLVVVPVSDDALSRIAAVDRYLHVVDARGWFDVELRETWPPWTVQRYLGQRLGPNSSRHERDQLLAGAEIILGGFPFPLDLRARRRACAGSTNCRLGRATCYAGISGAAMSSSPPRAAMGIPAPWLSMCWPISSTSPGACTMHLAIGSGIVSTIAPTVPCCCRVRRCASWAPVASARRWGGFGPVPACG